jgi:carboxyl-terminal processing protease
MFIWGNNARHFQIFNEMKNKMNDSEAIRQCIETNFFNNLTNLFRTFRTTMLVLIFCASQTTWIFAQPNGFVHAYDSMHQTFSAYYPMGVWKGIDWNALNASIRPKIENAAVSSDTIMFYTALQQYATSIHDGHVNIRHGWADIRAAAIYEQIGGSYGFVVTGLDDGRIVARLIEPDSPADNAGMQFGAEILEVNDSPVLSVLDTVSVLWAEVIPATTEAKKLNQYRFLGRAHLGESIKIKFQNRDASEPSTVTLVAVDDAYSTYHQTSIIPVFDSLTSVSSMLIDPGGYGYIKITSVYGEAEEIVQLYTDFRDAIVGFNNADVPGLILDIRSNMGGYDALAAALSGFFYNEIAFYEYQSWYNPESDTLEIWPLPIEHFNPATLEFYINPDYPIGALYTEPQGVYFDKPVIVLVGPRNISSGEGIPMMLQKLPNCKVVSFYGSNGSFAMVDRVHYFFPPPQDVYLRYPYGVSLNENFVIQLDSDSTMTGGVIPDIRVPVNDTVINQLYIDSLDVELLYAMKMLHTILGTEELAEPGLFAVLEQNVPNPFNTQTEITYTLSETTFVKLEVFDLSGRSLTTLVESKQPAGSHSVPFRAPNLKKGMYLYRLVAGNSVITRKC